MCIGQSVGAKVIITICEIYPPETMNIENISSGHHVAAEMSLNQSL